MSDDARPLRLPHHDPANAPLRVLQVAASVAPRDGGPATAMLEIHRALWEVGASSVLVSADYDGYGRLPREMQKSLVAEYPSLEIYRGRPPKQLKNSFGLAAALRRHMRDTDVVHIHGLYLAHTGYASRLARARGVPYFIQPHGSLEAYQRSQHRGRKALVANFAGLGVLPGAAGILFADESEADHAADVVPADKAHIVRLGARVDDFDASDVSAKLLALKIETRPSVLFMGRLAKKKRVDLLLDAWPQVLQQIPSALLVIAGPSDDALGDSLRQRASSLPEGSYSFVGPVADADKVYLLRNAGAFALPSENENFAIAIAEAMTAGLPIVVSDRVALHTFVTRHQAGVVVSALEPGVVADGLVTALTPSNAEAFRSGSMEAAKNFTWPATAQRLIDIYETVARTPHV